MSFGLRVVVVLVVGATVLSAACGGGDAGGGRVTLTEDGCTYEGDETPPSTETFEAEAENQSSKLGAFEVWRIDEGKTFADVDAFVESARQRLADGLEVLGPPVELLTQMTRAMAAPGESAMLVATVGPGQYVISCAHEHPPTAVFLAPTPLEVTE